MVLFGLFMVYMLFAAAFLTYHGIQQVLGLMKIQAGTSSVSVLLGNGTFRDIVLSLGTTIGLYIVISLLYFQPWHMITSFAQYTLLTPSFINILQVYALCNIHDVTWGTKEDGIKSLPSPFLDTAIPDAGSFTGDKDDGLGSSQLVHITLPDNPSSL